MTSGLDKVHIHGMSEDNSTYLLVDAHYDGDTKKEVPIEPPVRVIFEGDDVRNIAFNQNGLSARYHDDELRIIGEGSSALGIKRVIGEIATSGPLEMDAIKPLHPNIIDMQPVATAELSAPLRELIA